MAKKAAETKIAAKPKAAPAKTAAKAPVKAEAAKTPVKKAAPAPVKAAAPVTVTVKHLSAALGEQHGLQKKQAETIVADLFVSVVEHLKAGERVRIGGLGIIEVKDRPARMGRNPATGEAIEIKASKKVAFRAAKELKEAI